MDMEYINPFIDKYNTIVGIIVATLSFVFGDNWILFAFFLVANVFDELTGWYKAYVHQKENSSKGWKGVLKKFCYWVMIAVSFLMSAMFIEIGDVIGINLKITTLLGYFVLGSLFINEIRSIIENLVEADIYVPEIMKKGLEVADKLLKESEEANE